MRGDHDSLWPALKRTTTAFASEHLKSLYQCCGRPELRSMRTLLWYPAYSSAEDPTAFPTEESSGQQSSHTLPEDFTAVGPPTFVFTDSSYLSSSPSHLPELLQPALPQMSWALESMSADSPGLRASTSMQC